MWFSDPRAQPAGAAALLLLALAGRAAAEDLVFSFEGFVEPDPAGVAPIASRAEGAVVAWLAEDGAAVAAGDALALLDTSRIAQALEARRRDLAVAEVQTALDRLRLEQELAGLEDQRRALRAELATARARLGAVGADDALRRAEAEAEAGRADAAAERAGADAARSATAAADGDLAREEARLAADRAAAARARARQAALAAARAADADRAAERERLRVKVGELESRLGLGPDGSEDGRHGLGGRIAAVRARRAGQERNAAAELEARRREVQESERDVRDRLPLAWIELKGPGGAVRRIDLVAPGAEPAPGWEADRGAPFDARRGFGWDADVAPLMRAGGDGAPGRAGMCLVEGRRTWRIAVPDGAWTARLGLGDAVDWDGALVRLEGAPAWARNRIAGGTWPVCELRAAAAGGMLRLVFGDDRPKALRAEAPGLMLRRPGIAPGDRVPRRNLPLASVADPARLRINVRIAPDLAGLLRPPPPAAPGNPAALLRAGLAPARLAVRTADGADGPATAARVSEAPVGRRRSPTGWSDDEAGDVRDLLWREVWLAPAPGLAARPGAAVAVTATVALPPGARALLPHLVSLRDQAAAVAPAPGRTAAVAALRAGDRVVVSGAPAGALAAMAPPAPPGEDGPFAGEVVAGRCTRVVLPRSWGQVERVVADGARVEAGDELMLLASAWLERQRDRFAREKARAREDHRIAQENRRLHAIQAAQERDLRDGALAAARLDLDESLRGDPWPARLAEAAADAAGEALAAARARLQRLGSLAAPDPQELAAAGLAARRAELARAAAAGAVPAARRGADALALVRREEALHTAAAALRLGEDAEAIARSEAENAARSAHLRLENALQGNRREREFKEVRRVLAPAAGRVYLLSGWDEDRRAWNRIGTGVTVWAGLPLADIIQPEGLEFRAEVPERRYARLAEGAAAAVAFPQLGGLRVPGRVVRKARILDLPRDAREEALAPVAPVFAVTVALDIPADRRDDLAPGVRGMLELP